MKFKTLFLSLSLITVAGMFAYCTKETVTTEPTPTTTTTDDEANSRGVCKVNIQANNGTFDVCGVQNNATVCSTFGGFFLTGNTTVANGTGQSFLLQTPTVLLVSRNPAAVSAVNASVTVQTSSGAIQNYPVPPVGNAVINVGNACNLF